MKTKAKTAKVERKQFSADRLMTNLSLALIRDFQTSLVDPCLAANLQTELRRGDVHGIRREASALTCAGGVAEFKAIYQLQSILKRYRYQNDIYSDKELEEIAINGFLGTQSRLADLNLGHLSSIDNLTLTLAASYIAHTLGEYDDEEHRLLCRFGSGASVGVTARMASLASRWEVPLSGSQNQIEWFDSEMSQVGCVQDYWRKQQHERGLEIGTPVYHEVDSLKLVLVPKTYKSLRAIMPNTTIGSYMSYGLGEMIRKRLKRGGYDIRDLQMRHRYYAAQGSVHGLYVTADLSSASDSITEALVQRLFPPSWYEILSRSRIGTVELPNGQRVESKTFCTMGIGYTFPLQTLVFLSLLKAVEAINFHGLARDRRLISVYGDDMVYSTRMHDQVVSFFSKVGFVINLDKTFHEGSFRESCGGDYYHGVDVRPFQPRNGSAMIGEPAYEAMLYKCANGLLARWSEYEISHALNFLTSEIELIKGRCKIVPSDFPDDSGLKCSFPITADYLRTAKLAIPKSVGNGVYRFSYLRLKSDIRKETRHEPYLWEALRGDYRCPISYSGTNHRREDFTPVVRRINELTGIKSNEPQLRWVEAEVLVKRDPAFMGPMPRRLVPVVTISHTGTYKRQSGLSCFESRS